MYNKSILKILIVNFIIVFIIILLFGYLNIFNLRYIYDKFKFCMNFYSVRILIFNFI